MTKIIHSYILDDKLHQIKRFHRLDGFDSTVDY